MERKSKKDIINIIKGIMPAVFCIIIVVVAVNTGGADIRELPVRAEAGYEIWTPDEKQEQAAEVQVLSNNEDKNVKKNKKKVKTKNNKKDVNIKNLKDGTFTGTGTGFGGDIRSSVTIKDGKIISIKILSCEEETPSYFDKAKAVISLIIDKQKCNVDSVSGATYSSNGIIESVRNALRLARGEKGLKKKNKAETDKKREQPSGKAENNKQNNKKTGKNKEPETKNPDGTSNLKDGLYTGTGTGFGGEIKVNVKIKKGKITKISILSAEFETSSYFDKAKEIINTMIKKQSAEVDVITGATYSSNGIKEAVNNALLKAVRKKGQDSKDSKNNTDNINEDKDNDKDNNNNTENNNSDNENNNDDGSPGDTGNSSNSGEENGEWTLVSKTSSDYTYPVVTYCEPYTDDFEGYDIRFNIIITTETIVEENTVKAIRTTINNYVSSVEFEQDTVDYVMKTGNWSFLDMAANGTDIKTGLFGQLVSNNSVESFDTVSGATCSSDALAYGMKNTLGGITLGKIVVIN